jgi:hypothetical protein
VHRPLGEQGEDGGADIAAARPSAAAAGPTGAAPELRVPMEARVVAMSWPARVSVTVVHRKPFYR